MGWWTPGPGRGSAAGCQAARVRRAPTASRGAAPRRRSAASPAMSGPPHSFCAQEPLQHRPARPQPRLARSTRLTRSGAAPVAPWRPCGLQSDGGAPPLAPCGAADRCPAPAMPLAAGAPTAAAVPPPPPCHAFRVRTVTAFLCLPPGDEAAWRALLTEAGAFLARAQRALEAEGAQRRLRVGQGRQRRAACAAGSSGQQRAPALPRRSASPSPFTATIVCSPVQSRPRV
jgi:hypothetical protein